MDEAGEYESWFDTPFGSRADRVEKRLLSHLLSDFRDCGSLLEVGCGTGHFAGWWMSQGLDPVGLDLDVPRLRYAAERHPGLPLVLGEGTALPFHRGAFDIVALLTVLEFMQSPEDSLREAARVARKGVLLGVLNRSSPVAWWRRVRKSRAYASARFFSPRELERLVRDSMGRRAIRLQWKTGLYPLKWLDRLSTVPFGAFIGMSVRFEEGAR